MSHIETDIIPQLARLLIGHDLHKHFNICLPHRHFDLGNDYEQIVELVDQNGQSVSSVFQNGRPDESVLDDFGLVMPENPSIFPSGFLVLQDQLVPYEYSCKDRDEALNVNIPELPSSFLESWDNTVSQCGAIRGCLGLSLKAGNSPTLQICHLDRRVDRSLPLPASLPSTAFPTEWAAEPSTLASDGELTRQHFCGGPGFCPTCCVWVESNPCPRCGTSF